MDYDLIVVKTLERVYKNYYYIIRGIIMEQDKRVEDKKARFILLITQVVLWFMVMVMEMVVLIVKQINVSEHMLFLVSINLITIVTILINVHNYRKNKKRM